MHQLKFLWNDYFSGSPVTTLTPQEYKSRQTPPGTSVYVSNCLFNTFTSESTGGALYCTSVTYLLVELSSFFSCKTNSQNGGAIYFSNSGGECVLHGVCVYDCCSGSSSYQFAYIYVKNVASSKNYVNYSSITRCVNERSDSFHTLYFGNGNVCCPSVNLSMNKCGYFSGITPYSLCDASSVTCLLSYSSFTDNIAYTYYCICLDTSGANYEIKSCNILRNTINTGSYGIVYTSANVMIKDSCILENTAAQIFYQYYSKYAITLSNCTVDKTTNNQKLIIQNTVTKSFIHALNHISTQNCNTEYDAVGSLTAIPYIPSPTKKSFCDCCSCKMNHYQAKVSDFFTFISLFMITFIHPNPSGYC
jgi:hypothetical protein